MRDIELSVMDIRTLCNVEVFTIPSGSSTRLYFLGIIQHVAQSADGPCKARSHCPFNGAVKDSLRQEYSRCEALESSILLTRTDASPLAAGILILHHSF